MKASVPFHCPTTKPLFSLSRRSVSTIRLAGWMSADAHIAQLTTRCLFITGWIQPFFAAAFVFGGALRGAGDTLAVMIINLLSIIGIRFVGVVIVGFYLRMGLGAIWIILCTDLFCRGCMMYLRFLHEGWRTVQV
jgi:Na+-driven multidrug efflux pump